MNRTDLILVFSLLAFLIGGTSVEAQPLGRGSGSAAMAIHQHQAEQTGDRVFLKAHRKERKKLKAWGQWNGNPDTTPDTGTLAYILKVGVGSLDTVAKYGTPSAAWRWDIRNDDGVVVISFSDYFTEANYARGYYALVEGENGYHLFRVKNYSPP